MFLHIFVTPFTHESRVLKECLATAELDLKKTAMVAALWEPGLEHEEQLESGITVWRVALKSRGWPKNLLVQLVKYLEWMFRIVGRLKSNEITVIHAHRVSAMPVGVLLKWFTGAPLVYDAHELESEANNLSPSRRRLTRWLEGRLIRAADRTITVCDSIADWYMNEYGITRPAVIRNVPIAPDASSTDHSILREVHNVPDDALLYLYQGALAPGRGIETLLEVFAGNNRHRHLVLMGYGVLEERVIEAAARSASIHFQPAVRPQDVLSYTAGADIGLCLIENTCLSYYYSLPNKLFEYLLSGLPVVVNDMPEQRSIVESFKCGWIISPSPEKQIALFDSIERAALDERKTGVERAAASFDWELEAARLREVYSAIIDMNGT